MITFFVLRFVHKEDPQSCCEQVLIFHWWSKLSKNMFVDPLNNTNYIPASLITCEELRAFNSK